jgi:hypothetical protein
MTTARDELADLVAGAGQPSEDRIVLGGGPVSVRRAMLRPYGWMTSADLVADLAATTTGAHPAMLVELGRRLERGEIKGEGRDGGCE